MINGGIRYGEKKEARAALDSTFMRKSIKHETNCFVSTLLIIIVLFSGCETKSYEDRYNELSEDYSVLERSYDDLMRDYKNLEEEYDSLEESYSSIGSCAEEIADRAGMAMDYLLGRDKQVGYDEAVYHLQLAIDFAEILAEDVQ